MILLQLRPTFEIPLKDVRPEAIDKLAAEFARRGKGDNFLMHGEYGELHLPAAEHRLWSPHLSFYVSEREALGLIHGRFAPRLDVWTFVWVLYLAMAFSAFFGLALAYSQWMLGESQWGLWIAIVALLAIAALYIIANIGQQWSSDQMVALRNRLDEILHASGVLVAGAQAGDEQATTEQPGAMDGVAGAAHVRV